MARKHKRISYLKELRDQLNRLEGGINRQKYELLAEGYGYALEISEDAQAFEEFKNDDFFADRRKAPKQEDALRLAMVFLLEAKEGSSYDRACTYARALNPSFEAKVDPDEIPDLIEENGGIERLYRDVVARERYEGTGLQIEASAEELDEVLALDIDEECELRIKRVTDGKKGWVRFVIVRIKVDS